MKQKKLGRGRIIGAKAAPENKKIPNRPSALELDATIMAAPSTSNGNLREKASRNMANKTILAGTVMATEQIVKAIGKKKEEKKEIPFEEGVFKKVKQLSSLDNAVGDVWLAEKKYHDGRESELVVIKMLRSESELFDKKEVKDLEPGERELLNRYFQEAGEEIKNLIRFAENRHVVSPVGDVFPYEDRLVVQMEFVPHTLNEYLWNVNGEKELTDTILDAGIQILETIDHLEKSKDNEAPAGRVNNDLKLGNLGADKEQAGDGRTRIVIKMLDLDSIRPISKQLSIKRETKYSIDHCDPEQFMELHDNSTALNAKPAETVYSMGLALMYSIGERISTGLKTRRIIVFPTEYEEVLDRESRPTLLPGEVKEVEVTKHVHVINVREMREKIESTRETDELNLLKLYFANKQKRVSAGLENHDTPEMVKLIEKHGEVIVREIMPEVHGELNWCGQNKQLNEAEFITKDEIHGRFKGMIYGFEVDDKTAQWYGAETPKDRLLLGIELNIEQLTESYAKANYHWHTSAVSYSKGIKSWYTSVTELLQNVAGMEKHEAAEIVELAKKKEKGKALESTVRPEVFEAIVYCLKPRAERPDAEETKKIFIHLGGEKE